MEVTREYIMKHRTARGAWTLAQIEALGLVWPPLQGWIDSVVGQTITDEQARRFENNSIPRKGASKANPDQMQLF